MQQFENKIAIVTGATSGIGKATAVLLAARGAKVVVAGRRESEGNAVVAQIQNAGGTATFVKTDVTVEAEVENLVKTTVATYGPVDVAFLNSGVFNFAPITETTDFDLSRQIDINIKGVYYGIKHLVNAFNENGGAIVINSSVVADIGFPGASAYSLTKGAINTLTRTAAVELAGKKIRVNSVAPGPIWTEGAEAMAGARENFEAMMTPGVPLSRVGEPIEIAEAVAFLASDASAFTTGQVLNVDGGLGIK